MGKSFNPKQQLLCSLCGCRYTEEKGHNPNDCWGIIHQQLSRTLADVRGLQYKLEKARRRINEAKSG